MKFFRPDSGFCDILSKRNLLGLIVLITTLFYGWLNYFGGPNSQAYGLHQTQKWIKDNETKWHYLQSKNPELKHVELFAFTGLKGCLGVQIDGPLKSSSELKLLQFVTTYKVNRPVKIMHIKPNKN